MKQTRTQSILEAVSNNIISFIVAYGINCLMLPLLTKNLPNEQAAFILTGLFTLISFIRTYFIRRLFEWLKWRQLAKDVGRHPNVWN